MSTPEALLLDKHQNSGTLRDIGKIGLAFGRLRSDIHLPSRGKNPKYQMPEAAAERVRAFWQGDETTYQDPELASGMILTERDGSRTLVVALPVQVFPSGPNAPRVLMHQESKDDLHRQALDYVLDRITSGELTIS